MRGEQGKLKEIVALKSKYNFRFLVDDAHGFGTLGDNGTGAGNEQGVMKEIDVYDDNRGAVISSAIKVGNVRLIDNVLVGRNASNLISPRQLHYSNFRDL